MPNFKSVEQLDLSNRLVVVSGGTQGIGAAVATLCASRHAKVAIIGRNPTLGGQVLDKMSSGSSEHSPHCFIKADLSTAAGTNEAAAKLKEWATPTHIDYLFMSQGGPPAAAVSLTKEDLEYHFAIQVMSRFVLAYELLESNTMKSDGTVVSIAAAGRGGSAAVDPEKIDGRQLGYISRMSNGAALIDCFTKEFITRYPSRRFLHLWPGPVNTNTIKNSDAPYIAQVVGNIGKYIGLLRSPDNYAHIAVWTAASPEAKSKKERWSWGTGGEELKPARASNDEVLRRRVWDRLVSLASAGQK